MLKLGWWVLEKSGLPGVLNVELLACQVSMVSDAK